MYESRFKCTPITVKHKIIDNFSIILHIYHVIICQIINREKDHTSLFFHQFDCSATESINQIIFGHLRLFEHINYVKH